MPFSLAKGLPGEMDTVCFLGVCVFVFSFTFYIIFYLSHHRNNVEILKYLYGLHINPRITIVMIIIFFSTGPRYVVQIGDKIIDYNEEFRLFLATRNPSPFIPPDAASVITEVNFTTTRAGLRGQVFF